MNDVEELKNIIEKLSLAEGLEYINEKYNNMAVFSSSFGQEDQVIFDSIAKNNLDIRIFTLDTGRLFQETYELMDNTKSRYNRSFETYFPDATKVENLVKEKGFNSFYFSVENRKECCFIRKIIPLKRALEGAKVWITGVRAEQSENRADMQMVEWDEGNKVIKYNPLLHWSYDDVLNYIDLNQVPDNVLHKKGFISIGCQSCTRAISPGEHPRAGRWWWEASQKECGLHSVIK